MHQLTKATRPTAEAPSPPIEMKACPDCGKKTNVRRLTNPKAYFCLNCDLTFGKQECKNKPPGRPKKYTITIKAKQAQVDKIIELWQAGVYLGDIAETVKMDPDDVAILLIDLGRDGKVVFGSLGVMC